jgi:hypothetical protein
MIAVIVRDMFDRHTRKSFKRVFVTNIEEVGDLRVLLQEIEERFPREESRDDKA